MVERLQRVSCFFLLVVPSVAAWGGTTHVGLTRLALSRCSPQVRSCLQAHRSELEKGVLAPDRKGRGSIAAYHHTYDPRRYDQGLRRFGGAVSWVGRLQRHALQFASRDDAHFAFELGRLLHILQDMTQPFHTGSGCKERRYHSRYERWVDERVSLVDLPKGKWLESKSEWCLLEALAEGGARRARGRWWALHLQCRRKPWGDDLKSLSEDCLVDAVEISRRGLEEMVRRRKRLSAPFRSLDCLWLALVILFLHLVARSGPRTVSHGRA